MRLTSPLSTLPGPISTNVAPGTRAAARRMQPTQRTGAVSWSRQQPRGLRGRSNRLGRRIGDDRDAWVPETGAGQAPVPARHGRLHQRASGTPHSP